MWRDGYHQLFTGFLMKPIIRMIDVSVIRKLSIVVISCAVLLATLEKLGAPNESTADDYFPVSPEASMTTAEIIKSRGYPVEVHPVTTQDGYILELHRIPSSWKSINSQKGKPVFLQHGIYANDFVWITGRNDNALAFMLADQGYDVWLANSRGNTYSRKHVKLDPEGLEYWDFSWDEMSKYDLPASFNYVLKHTNQSKLSYVGYSLGCTLFFGCMAERPEINDLVEVMIALGIIANMRNAFQLVAPFNDQIQYISKVMGTGLSLAADGYLPRFLRFLLASSRLGAIFGAYAVDQIFGYSQTFDKRMLHVLAGHYPSGGSMRSMGQFFENFNSGGKFTKYNYGPEGNLVHYGTTQAPEYDLSKVKVPVHLFWGATDPVVPPEDVQSLARKLGNLRSTIRVNADVFSHGDFFMSTRVAELVNKPAAELLPPPYDN